MRFHGLVAFALLLLLLLPSGSRLASARQPSALVGRRLAAAKRDFRRVVSGKLDLGAWKKRHGVSNGVMTRLRRAHPDDFPHLDRARTFSKAELDRMQVDWTRAREGAITLTRFKAIYGLGNETYKRLMAQHGDRFEPFELKLGGSRLATKRRAKKNDPARIEKLAKAWADEVLGGKLTVRAFYAKHGTSKREITRLRKQPEHKDRFPSATALHASLSKQSLSATQIKRLSDVWKQGVFSGDKTIAQFRREHGLTQRVYRELRADKKAFPDPIKTPNRVGAPRRTFDIAELDVMTADWKRVASRHLSRSAFMRKHRIDAKQLKRLRTAHPERFFYLGASTRTKRFADAKLEAMKADWLTVIAGRMREADFRQRHGLSTTLFRRFREDKRNRDDFPKLKGSGSRSVVVADAAVIDDWARVRDGKLAASAFRRRHPDVKAVELLALQRRALRERKSTLAEQLGFNDPPQIVAEAKPKAKAKPKREPKPREASRYARSDLYAASTLDAAKVFFGEHHRGEKSYKQLQGALEKLGISTSGPGIAYLRKLDPIAFAPKREFIDRNHDAIIKDLIRIAKAHQHVIRKWSDFEEVVAKDAVFVARYGDLEVGLMSKTVRRDRDGNRQLHDLMASFTQVGSGRGPARGSKRGAAREKQVGSSRSASWPRRDSARTLARALRGLKPTPANLAKVVVKLKASGDPNFRTRRQWMLLRAEYDGVLPELAKWNFDRHRPYSLRYVARWAVAAHEAGPGADYDAIVKIFKRSAEYKADGRLPPKATGTVIMAKSYPELVSSWSVRRTIQRTRLVLELLRTAPAGTTLYALRDKLAAVGFKSYNQAHLALTRLTRAKVKAMGLRGELYATLRANGFKGLGQRANPRFDPNAEPGRVDIQLAREILAVPTMPPLLQHAVKRLDGDRPFTSHNVMFVYHRYSDIVSLVDAMAAAGMSRKDATFVSTPYPFKDSISYIYRKRGLTVLEPKLSQQSYARTVEQGIRKMLAKHAEEERKWGKGKPILILDDGGMAATIIGEKFKEHIGKFRIVEVTADGHRQARAFEKKHGRLAFPYFSIAYMRFKRRVTSSFYGNRVVDRMLNLVPQTREPLKNKRATVLGAGPMGLFAGLRLAAKGHEVTFVDPDKRAQTLIRRLARKRPDLGLKIDTLERALPGRAIILGMSGYPVLEARHLALIDDGAFVAQGSSKRKEFHMAAIEKAATSKKLMRRTDGLAQKSYTYAFGRGARAKRIHFLGDGWTLNHDGSLHGTPMKDVQLELAILFESAVQAARTPLGQTGIFRTVDKTTQKEYVELWQRLVGRKR